MSNVKGWPWYAAGSSTTDIATTGWEVNKRSRTTGPDPAVIEGEANRVGTISDSCSSSMLEDSRMKRLCLIALSCVCAMVLCQGCMSVMSQKLAPGTQFANIQGRSVSLVTGTDTEVRWLFIPVHSMKDTARLQAKMAERIAEDGGSKMHLLNASYAEIPLWAIPPYCLFPMPAKTISFTGVGTTVP
jgi:hypothetical protein